MKMTKSELAMFAAGKYQHDLKEVKEKLALLQRLYEKQCLTNYELKERIRKIEARRGLERTFINYGSRN